MDKDFWLDKWARDEIGFHEPAGNRLLQRWWPDLAVPPETQVLVPLCGKSVDLRWLQQQGYRVLGIELSEKAVQAFFDEQGLQAQVEPAGAFQRWSADGIEILQGDVFSLTAELLAEVGALYDRAALIALPAELRSKYVELLRRLLSPKVRGLLVTLEYLPDEEAGPPYSVSEQEMHRLFDVSFALSVLVREDVLAENPKFLERGRQELYEVAYALLPAA